MAKDGKFAVNNNAKDVDAVNGVATSAVSKRISTLVIAIRNTVDSGLKKVNGVLATVKQEDKSGLKEINKVLGEIKEGKGSEVKN
ncbi:Variable outer membrane protein [Borrelia duttonii CR2A]|uniref:Variable large protein n=1 Tax=Borrelia duttonii CR2A TaxID=1432657 RepID=W6TGY0_9SPIR|nr:Variable outer membrane protein [Borrelia duttonii CR2A]